MIGFYVVHEMIERVIWPLYGVLVFIGSFYLGRAIWVTFKR